MEFNDEELYLIAKCVEEYADKDTSKHKTTRAARILLKYLNL